jgi:hypothetical protein
MFPPQMDCKKNGLYQKLLERILRELPDVNPAAY